MKFDKYIKIGVLGIALWSLTGCTDWLDVQPVDQVAEEQMFTSEEGFRQGLNGVYVELCSSSLYGGDLLTGTVEPTITKCVEKEFFHEVPHVCPIHTHVINRHVYKHTYSPQFTCSEENQVVNLDCGKCSQFMQ